MTKDFKKVYKSVIKQNELNKTYVVRITALTAVEQHVYIDTNY